MKTRRRISPALSIPNNTLPRVFIEENQEFIIEDSIFTWYFSNPELRQGIVLNRKGVIKPSPISVTTVKKNKMKKTLQLITLVLLIIFIGAPFKALGFAWALANNAFEGGGRGC